VSLLNRSTIQSEEWEGDVHVEKESFRVSVRPRYLCNFLRSTGWKQTTERSGTGAMQIFWRKDNHCSIKGNVKENIPPSTGAGKHFLGFQPPSP